MPKTDPNTFARQVIEAEVDAVRQIALDERFAEAVAMIVNHTGGTSPGRLVVSGMGKCNFIAQKISATFASTGTPSLFLHPSEAVHGDLGRIRKEDVVLLLSFSGNTDEVVNLSAYLKQDGVKAIAMTGNNDSLLARQCNLCLWIGDVTEACPHNLAPTASTTAMLALGDALALTVSNERNFSVQDFQKFHPGGALGRQLMPIVEALRFKVGVNLPLFKQDITLMQAIQQSDEYAKQDNVRRAGAMLIVDDAGKLAGIFTDGDLRRMLSKYSNSLHEQPLKDLMTQSPRCLTSNSLVRDAVQLIREYRIDELPVVDDNKQPIGLIDVQDLVALKVIEA